MYQASHVVLSTKTEFGAFFTEIKTDILPLGSLFFLWFS